MDYAAARQVIPTALRASALRERVLFGLFVSTLGYHFASSWHQQTLAAASKVTAAKCEPLVLNDRGEHISLVPLSDADITLVDGMVVTQLADAVTCVRGLDSAAKAVANCWKRSEPLFGSKESAAKLKEYQRSEFGNPSQVLERMQLETVEVQPATYSKPEPNLPHRYYLRWTETHRAKTGLARGKPEVWSGIFDVEVVAPSPRSGNWNSIRITNWSWRREVVGS